LPLLGSAVPEAHDLGFAFPAQDADAGGVEAKEAAVRIARLTQEYTQVLGDLPRRILEQMDGNPLFPGSPGSRRRQGRIID